jgi:hypothetical protein
MIQSMFSGQSAAFRTELMTRARDVVHDVSAALQRNRELSPELRDKIVAIQATPGMPIAFSELSLDGALRALIELVRDDVLGRG